MGVLWSREPNAQNDGLSVQFTSRDAVTREQNP